MKQVKVSEATNIQLDWMVSTLTNPEWDYEDRAYNTFDWIDTGDTNDEQYSPSTDWSQGGPIIEWEKIGLSQITHKGDEVLWVASAFSVKCWGYGPTPLVAAMRCHVTSKLGGVVEVPERLS